MFDVILSAWRNKVGLHIWQRFATYPGECKILLQSVFNFNCFLWDFSSVRWDILYLVHVLLQHACYGLKIICLFLQFLFPVQENSLASYTQFLQCQVLTSRLLKTLFSIFNMQILSIASAAELPELCRQKSWNYFLVVATRRWKALDFFRSQPRITGIQLVKRHQTINFVIILIIFIAWYLCKYENNFYNPFSTPSTALRQLSVHVHLAYICIHWKVTIGLASS